MDPITTGLLTNLLASGLLRGNAHAHQKLRAVFRDAEFSTELDDLETEFYRSLRDAIEDCKAACETNELTDIVEHWDAVVERLEVEYNEESLDDTDRLLFESEAAAIDQLADAIAAVQGFDLDKTPQLQQALTEAVTEAYDRACQQFSARVADTEVAEVFKLETGIELRSAVDELEERLTAVQRKLRWDTAALGKQGFERLDALYFERHEPGTPESAWRFGFTFADVAAGYPLPRERLAARTGERASVVDEVFTHFSEGEDVVVLGDSGTGKSAVCKQIAYRWYANTNRGSVLYRESGNPRSFDNPEILIEAIRVAEEELLVVIEDAPSGTTNVIFKVIEEFEHASDVAFLLDARTDQWKIDPGEISNARRAHKHTRLHPVEMPDLDERECQRAIAYYQELTGEAIGRTAEQVYEEVRTTDIGGPLVLAYQLTGPAKNNPPASALHHDVRQAYAAVKDWAAEDDLKQTVAVMVNVLNAADLPVNETFVHALATDNDEHLTIDETLSMLTGTVLKDDDRNFQTPHQLWSAVYLQVMLEEVRESTARYRFQRCVAALFRLIDDAAVRATVRRWVCSPHDAFTTITDSPEMTAGWLVYQLAEIGTIRPTLGALYGTPETWQVQLPDPCPLPAHIQWFIIRSRIHIKRSALDAAQAECEHADRLIDTMEIEMAGLTRQQIKVRTHLGIIAQTRGELEIALKAYREALALAREIDDRPGEAGSLGNLGTVAAKGGRLKDAKERFEEALALYREVGDRRGEAKTIDNLGTVAEKRRELETAKKRFEEARALYREIGDRHGKAKSRHNLGRIATAQGDLANAEEYFETAVVFFRDNEITADAFAGFAELIDVCEQRGAESRAIEWCEQAIEFADRTEHATEREHFQERRSELGDTDE